MKTEKYIIIRYESCCINSSGITCKSDWSAQATINYLKILVEEMEKKLK